MVARLGLIFGLLISLSTETFAAVSAQLSEQDIDELESVRLILRATETRQTETLDLSALEDQFHVMGTNTSSQYRFVNGREQSWVDYQITLQPKKTGLLKIPPIQVGRDTTPPLELRVRALSSQTREKIKELVFFETEVSKSEVYVQAQVIFTRRLLYSNGVQLYSDLPGPPELPNAVVLTLGETSAGSVKRGDQVYGVVEQRYAIFPEASGRLILPAISVTASVRLLEGGRVSRKGVRVGTSDTVLYVMPVPPSFPSDQPWLPAEDVAIHQEIDVEGTLNVGDTALHELLVHIRGNVGSIAPPIEWQVSRDQLRTYPQNPIINDDTNSNRVSGSRLQTTSVVPLTPGNLVIPQQTVYWWNTDTNKLATSTAPALTLPIGGTAVEQLQPPTAEPKTTPDNTETSAELPNWRPAVRPAAWTAAALLSLYLLYRLVQSLFRRIPARGGKNQTSLAGIKSAGTLPQLQTAITNYVARQNHTNRQNALAMFIRSSSDHRAFIDSLRSRAYSGTDEGDKGGEGNEGLEPTDSERAIKLVKAMDEDQARVKPAALPPLYDWSTNS
ncbi:MAG: hypothetical protein GKR90_04065 [Pseudomonadales bacterium]|nr:hypothetical protein [Pseudomonadales bacterium]